ncbi:MAG: CBS domain-containing protein [Anaerolineae bacterium]|nr:CBS domain-containing protein [Anaerolineae bacterium]
MNVSDIMTAKPVTIHQDGSLRQALEMMDHHQCRHLPVMNSNGQVVGIVSDRDLRTALNSPHILRDRWQDEELINNLRVRTIMTPAPVSIEPDADADEAVRLMLDHHISSLPVMLGETLVGIVTTSDILVAFMEIFRRVKRYHEIGS